MVSSIKEIQQLEQDSNTVAEVADTDVLPDNVAEVFALPNGKTITRLKLSAKDYFQYQAILSRNQSEASKWLITKMFLLSNTPITLQQLDSSDPNAEIGFLELAIMNVKLGEQLTPSQTTTI